MVLVAVAVENMACKSFEVAVPLRVYVAVCHGVERLERDEAMDRIIRGAAFFLSLESCRAFFSSSSSELEDVESSSSVSRASLGRWYLKSR